MFPRLTAAEEDTAENRSIIEQLTGSVATESPRVLLEMPPVFANGYSVPLTLAVDSPMTESDYVKSVLVVAPRNPLLTVAKFRFTAQSGRVLVSTRIRLSQPQSVLAVAQMSDGSMLMTRRWIKVEIDGCS
jgi:sulfur-oxidizing protein SoxY